MIILIFFAGLFHRVILMSGSSFAPWARVKNPLNYAIQLGKAFNCTVPVVELNNDHERIFDCLRNVSADRLMSAKVKAPNFQPEFGPSFDGVTIRDHDIYYSNGESRARRSHGSR